MCQVIRKVPPACKLCTAVRVCTPVDVVRSEEWYEVDWGAAGEISMFWGHTRTRTTRSSSLDRREYGSALSIDEILQILPSLDFAEMM